MSDKNIDDEYKTITIDEIRKSCQGTFRDYFEDRLLELATGEYSLDEFREDCLSWRQKDE